MKNSLAMHGVTDKKRNSKKIDRNAVTSPMNEGALDGEFNRGLRDRIIAELDASNIAEDSRVQYLASLTGRAFQTARRWIASDKPGLPDLTSFVLLCYKFNSDANWMLGLIGRRYPLPTAVDGAAPDADAKMRSRSDWVEQLQSQVPEFGENFEVKSMIGDDMEPRIRNGAPIWVDPTVTEIQTNGIYLLEYEQRILVRQVEFRIGEGLVLSCENERYKPTLLKDANAAKKVGLKVLGRVRLSLAIETL